MIEALTVHHGLRVRKGTFALAEGYEGAPFLSYDVTQEARLRLWASENMFRRFRWFVSGPEQSLEEATRGFPVSFPTPREELRRVLDIFRGQGPGYEVYVYEAAHEILTTLGYHAVRVIIPALAPLYLNEPNAPLGASRLREVPRRLGYEPRATFNPLPHPFP